MSSVVHGLIYGALLLLLANWIVSLYQAARTRKPSWILRLTLDCVLIMALLGVVYWGAGHGA